MKRLTTLLLLFIVACSVNLKEKHWRLAEQYLKQDQLQRAIDEYTKVIHYGPKDEMAQKAIRQIARIYEEYIKNYPKAIESYQQLKNSSENEDVKLMASWRIAKIYQLKLNNLEKSSEEYKELYELIASKRGEGPEVLLEWAQSLTDAGKFEESILRFKEFRKKYPGHKHGPKVYLYEGQGFLSLRDGVEAQKVFSEIIELFSQKQGFEGLVAEAFFGLGESLEIKDELKEAVSAFEKARGAYPNKNVLELKIKRVQQRIKQRKI